jgi:hypothetical protein
MDRAVIARGGRARDTRTSAIVTAVTAVMAVMVALSACAGGEGGGPERPAEPRDAARARAVRAETLALAERIWAAEEDLNRRCMQRLGFTVHPATPAHEVGSDDYPYPRTPTLAAAEHAGYAGASEPGPPPGQAPTEAFLTLPAVDRQRYLTALEGPGPVMSGLRVVTDDGGERFVPTSGCRGETMRVIFADLSAAVRLLALTEHSVVRAQRAADADPRVTTVLERWSACMREAGHPGLRSPEDARGRAEAFFHEGPSSDARRRAVALAVADVHCAVRHDLDRVRHDVWSEHLVADQVAHEADLVALRELQVEALRRAQAALADG